MNKDAVNGARSLYYGLFSKFFIFTSREDRYEGIKEALDVLIKNPLDENSCEALKEVREFIELNGTQGLSLEFDKIFHDFDSETLRDTASFYSDGIESGKKRVEVKNFLAKTKIRRDEKNYKDNEDSIGFLMIFMHELIELMMKGEKQYETVQHCLFTEIINEFFDEFIVELYEHENANTYKSVAIVLNAFLEFERLYFDVQKPAPKEKPVRKKEDCEFISDKEAKRRAENKMKKESDTSTDCSIEEVSTGTEEEGDL